MSELKAEAQTGTLARLEALLGEDVFFVPCEWRTKKPLVTYVQRPFEGTKTREPESEVCVRCVRTAGFFVLAANGQVWTRMRNNGRH